MKRTKSSGRRQGRETISSAKKKAWKAFSEYVRLRDALRSTGTRTSARCITCSGIYSTSGLGCIQAGHFIPGRNNSILFEETNCHAQCPSCNIWGHGKQIEYFVKMEEMYGREEIERLRSLSHQVKPWTVSDLLEIKEKYETKAKELG